MQQLTIIIFYILVTLPLQAVSEENNLNLFRSKKDVDYNILFKELVNKVKDNYVDEVSDQKLIESALEGMLSALDPHSSYLTEKEFLELYNDIKGEFGGLGAEVTLDRGFIKIISPYEDSPAFKNNLKTGDYITMIDNQMVKGLSLGKAVEKLRGKPKTKVKLTIYRETTGESFEVTIIRELIKLVPVKSKLIANDIILLRITNFSESAAELLKKEFHKLMVQAGENKISVKGIILDLRSNPGGLLDQAKEVTELFLEEGVVVSTKGRLPESNRVFEARGTDITDGLPMVVLINEGSASAPEIVAGALQDNKRALVVGTKSFGKGSVQTTMPINSTNSAIKLTTARYYTPSGRSIQAQGIAPDVIVEDAVVTPVKNNYSSSEASLLGHLPADKQSLSLNHKEDLSNSIKIVKKPVPINVADSDKDAQDFQLIRAIDLVKGMALYSERLVN